MDEALDAGINLFDTADVYGGPQSPEMDKGYGTSEEIIGRWLAQGGRRNRIVLATKVYQPMDTGPNDRRLSAYHIRRACEASLRRLKTDHIDLYQMHHVDRATPWEEIWQAMEQLIREGKITYVGSSNFAGWDIATAQCTAASRNLLGLASEQSPLQPRAAHHRARGDSGAASLRGRSHPLWTDRLWFARRGAPRGSSGARLVDAASKAGRRTAPATRSL
ncbi:aldo/keto reductase [Mesorhizobium abyssinicae]|uniref:Aldo/keto reductase n=1 Tax=Mesorhizobium abyssinicae TaxID=1209958 RepID=A0ABU5AVB3_9HYPH|nr:aldo/keto reductase [Mesorhizobium abyssinicae]MDX8541161.1 aldo/keto reductase [Mesorhizobium abyssinicae]